MQRLIVVSNRVAAPTGVAAAGGLAIGLHNALKRSRGIWLGWNGRVDDNTCDVLDQRDGDEYQLATASLSEKDHAGFYIGTANRVLWPILHGRADLVRHHPEERQRYFEVNRRFARHLARLACARDLIWVHDYHFLSLGEELRRHHMRSPIGFFLHVPFPSADIVAGLPDHHQLFRKLSAYDLIGFQTEESVRNFGDYAVRYLGARACPDGIMLGKRRIRIAAFPIGIAPRDFGELATSASAQRLAAEWNTAHPRCAGIIGVDRLDYTKGLPVRFRAFERFLDRAPDWHRKIVFSQIAAPSREAVPEYMDLRRELETLSGSINAHFSRFDWTPLRYMNQSFSQWQLAALYRVNKIGLVTPLADGMNLVAKEYVAAQDPADPGVLILSRFAGAASQLTSALIVDPGDTEAVAGAIRAGLEMPLAERRSRWASAMQQLVSYDIHHWHDRFLDALAQREPVTSLPAVRSTAPITGGHRKAATVSAPAGRQFFMPPMQAAPAIAPFSSEL